MASLDIRLLLFVVAFLWMSKDLCAEEGATRGERPNVVFLLADDLGWTGLRSFGSDFYETPNLDQLAAEGLRFTNAYAACTVCSPTRASIMTGMYPARLRCTDFIAGQFRPKAKLLIPDWTKQLESKYVTLAEAFKAGGYRTAHIGKWHLEAKGEENGTDPLSQGFDVSIQKPPRTKGYFLASQELKKQARSREATSEVGGGRQSKEQKNKSRYLTDWLTDRACDYIKESSKTSAPFFLYFAYHTPHTPIQGRPDLVEKFRRKVDPQLVHHNPSYAAMVASLDASVGKILESLRECGVDDNTLVVFTSDNGGLTQRYGVHDGFTENLPLRRGKGSAYEGGVRVPTILWWSGRTPVGQVCETPIMTIDYYPTLLAACNLEGDRQHNDAMDGVSILPLLTNPEENFERNLYWHYPHYHAGGDGPYSAVRSGDYRLIEFHEDQNLELFNLKDDLGEQTNLAMKMPEKAKELKEALYAWRASVEAQMPTPNPNYDPSAPRRAAKKR